MEYSAIEEEEEMALATKTQKILKHKMSLLGNNNNQSKSSSRRNQDDCEFLRCRSTVVENSRLLVQEGVSLGE